MNKKNSRKETESPKKKAFQFTATSYTKQVIERFLQIDRWGFLKSRRKGIEFIFEVLLVKQFEERLEQICEFVDLNKKRITMRAFYKICRAKNIFVLRYKREEIDLYGQYWPGYHINYLGWPANGDGIWLRGDLKGKLLLEVAAHEISHFCLHREIAITTKKLSPYCKELNVPALKSRKDLIAEIETDLMTAMLLTKKEVSDGI